MMAEQHATSCQLSAQSVSRNRAGLQMTGPSQRPSSLDVLRCPSAHSCTSQGSIPFKKRPDEPTEALKSCTCSLFRASSQQSREITKTTAQH